MHTYTDIHEAEWICICICICICIDVSACVQDLKGSPAPPLRVQRHNGSYKLTANFYRAPKDHVNTTILQHMIYVIPLFWALNQNVRSSAFMCSWRPLLYLSVRFPPRRACPTGFLSTHWTETSILFLEFFGL